VRIRPGLRADSRRLRQLRPEYMELMVDCFRCLRIAGGDFRGGGVPHAGNDQTGAASAVSMLHTRSRRDLNP
jgi:hypothetical protein